MEPQTISDWISREINVAMHASFWVAVAGVGLVIWWMLDRHYRGRLDTKDATIQHQDRVIQDYKDKLAGATPEEARARIEALESRLKDIAPRTLTPAQRAKLTEAMRPFEGQFIQFDADIDSGEAINLQQVLLRSFSAANWNISQSASHISYGLEERAPGMTIFICDTEHPSPAEEALMRELTDFGLDYRVAHNLGGGIRVMITARF